MLLSNQLKHNTNELKEIVPLQNAAPMRLTVAFSTPALMRKQKPEKGGSKERKRTSYLWNWKISKTWLKLKKHPVCVYSTYKLTHISSLL